VPTDWGFAYKYGLEIHQDDDATTIGHGGGMPGYEAFLLMDMENGIGLTLLSTQPSIGIRGLAWRVMALWRQAYRGADLETVDLSLADSTHIENAADFAGTYRSYRGTFTLTVADRQLILYHQGTQVVLEQRGRDRFYVAHPRFDRFLLNFGRADGNDGSPGPVVEASWGGDRYVNDAYTGPTEFDCPSEWHGYTGHYRAHIPWQTNFRVVLRKGALWLVWPSGDEEPLTPLGQDLFRIGNEVSPERLRFSQIAGGQALCANYSGSDYYRFFTP
jgi:hypothetical protein